MADSQRKTANLFDKDNTTIYNAYFSIDSDSSIWLTNADSRSVKIPCKPNTQYTLSISSAIPIFRICSSSNANIEPSVGGVRVRTIIRSENIQQYTFTTSADDACILFQGSASSVNEWFNSLVLNEGSTPLPYEPYWQHSLRKLATSTDTLTTLPADIYANDNNATVGLKGNMSQSSQPSPTTPIQPQECGERTGNLCPPINSAYGWAIGYRNSTNGDYIPANNQYEWLSPFFKLSDFGTSFTISADKSKASDSMSVYYYNGNSFIASQSSSDYNGHVFNNIPNGTTRFCFAIRAVAKTESEQIASGWRVWVNAGSTALPYEPYGYKIPISSAGQTTPVYLGEVETTRKIKKLVLTGEEEYIQYGGGTGVGLRFTVEDMRIPSSAAQRTNGCCTHFVPIASPSGATGDNITFGTSSNIIYIILSVASQQAFNVTTYDEFKVWIAAQYANGTPVTVWYVLANETTGIVNEPLRKIGNYADTVSGITIPTTTGADSFDVLTTLKPSEVELTYTGWHDASVGECDGSEWQ